MKLYEVFIIQKLKEGWTVEDFTRFFNVTRRRAELFIENALDEERRSRDNQKEGAEKGLGSDSARIPKGRLIP